MIQVDPDTPSADALAEAASVLARGGLVAFATETVYGLGAVATDPAAVARIFAAKGRPRFNPLIVHVDEIALARSVTAGWTESAERLASAFWPGPLTLVLPRSPSIPDQVTGGRETVAVRAPRPLVARSLIARVGLPLAAPSANRSNRLSPTRAEHVLADLDGLIDVVLDSGPTAIGLESTVLDLTSSPFRILRPGPIGPEQISECLGGTEAVEFVEEEKAAGHSTSEPPASPGMLDVHYAPRTPTVRVDSIDELTAIAWPERSAVVVLGPEREVDERPNQVLVRLPDPETAAQRLYQVLHDCDALNLELIVIVMPPNERSWRTVRDRLVRAARPFK